METLALRIADAFIVLIWGGVSVHFFLRFLKHKKLVSMALAIMPLGWIALGLGDGWRNHLLPVSSTKALAILAGGFLTYTIVRVERYGK